MIREVRSDGTIDFGGAFTSIPRPRVHARIREAAQQRIALVVAPAGYGKSTALREYLAAAKGEHLLYELAPENATLFGFVRGLVNALGETGKKSQRTLVGALAESRDSETRASDIASWLHSHIKGFVGTIAIDDLHIGDQDPEISAFLGSLIERTRGRIRWILASRTTLDLPIASWLAYGETGLAVDEIDLAFDLDEARRAAKSARVAVRDDELQAILSLTGGWPTALAFALRSSTRSADLRRTTLTTREMIFRYLAEQVYADLPDDMRDFLLTVSRLPRLEIPVITCAGFDMAESMLEWLRNRVSFISLESPGIYRVHDLFREFLEYQLRLLGQAAVFERTSRIAGALEASGHLADAIAMYVRAEAWDDVARLVSREGFRLHELGHADLLERAVKALPSSIRSHNPVVLGLRAAFESERRRYDDAERLYARAIKSTNDEKLKLNLAMQLTRQRISRQQKSASEPLAGLVGKADSVAEREAEAFSLLACAYAAEGRTGDAVATMIVAREMLSSVDDDEVLARVDQHAGFVALHAGDIPGAARYSLDAATRASHIGLYGLAATAFTILFNVFEAENDSSQALWYAQQVVSTAQKSAKRYLVALGLLALFAIEGQRGNVERLAEVEAEIRSSHGPEPLRDATTGLATLALRQAWAGEFLIAAQTLAGAAQRVVDPIDRVVVRSMHALYLSASDQRPEALECLTAIDEEIDSITARSPNETMRLELIRSFTAVANALIARNVIASRWLRGLGPASSGLAEAARTICEGLAGVLDGDRLREAIGDLEAHRLGGYARLFATIGQSIERKDVPAPGLTASEVAVLRALAAGRSPKTIALENGRSVNTVSNHIRSAISKLGCHGRAEAIAIARRRGYLDEKQASQI